MFISPNFTFNGIYSSDMNISICTVDNNNMLNNIAVDYISDVIIENSLVDYHPYFTETFSESNDIELDLLVYDYTTMTALDINEIDMEAIYDWLITDSFAPFISDDDLDVIYYFKVIKISKVLSYDNKGYLKVTFKPYSKYAYRREVYDVDVYGEKTIEIYNPSKKIYYPQIELINMGITDTINKINDMEIVGLKTQEKIIIDGLVKLVQTGEFVNKFDCCNRKWIKLPPRESTVITLSGDMVVKIICEFPILK